MKGSLFSAARLGRQAGLTLVELMVSLVLVSVITLAVLALYNSSAATYKTTDSNQELQDNARFIFEVVSQAVRQAGLQDAAQYSVFKAQNQPTLAPSYVWDTSRFGTQPALFGYNDAKVVGTTSYGANDNGGLNASDVFGVRYFGSSTPADPTVADGSIIDCRGIAVPYPLVEGDIGLSLLQVGTGASGEPELQCINRARTQVWPIVAGVETFQVMYAVDTDAASDTTPNRWLNGKEVGDAGLWPSVRTVRMGIVLRGAVGSGVNQAIPALLYPLGEDFSKVSGTVPSNSNFVFTPPSDGRLRRAFTFNIAVRNTVEQ
jgi:type IV pilus assembly protein PilW